LLNNNNYLFELLNEKPNGSDFVHKLNNIRNKAKDLLFTINSVHPQFTPHTIEHKEKIIEIFPNIFPKSLLNALGTGELFFLIAATYLHDIGMGELSKLNDIDFKTIDATKRASIIRDKHHLRTENYINKFPSDFNLNNTEAYIIGKICKGHRKEDLFNTTEFKYDYTYNFEKINIPLLAIMLKLADELDITHTRTPRIIFENITLSNIISEDEWMKSMSIDGIALTQHNTVIKCNGRTSSPKIFFLIKEIEKKINQLVIQLPHFLHEYSKFTKDLPNRFEADIECQGFVPWNIKFLFDERNIMNIFSSLLLYQRPEDAIRELLKNSLDACNRRLENETDFNNPRISIQLNKEEKTLTIDDNGIGMNEYDLKNFFVKIGSSIYNSLEFTNSKHTFIPLSELGIGFLSSFMLASNIEMDTKKNESEAIKVDIQNLTDYLTIRRSQKREMGTTIKLYLKDEIIQNLKLKESVDYYLRHIDIPITIKENDSKYVIHNNTFYPSNDIDIYLKQLGIRFLHIPIDTKNFNGLLSLCMRYNESHKCFIPMRKYGSLDLQIAWERIRIISNNGIRILDNSILPNWFRSTPYWIDINFHSNDLKLDASRSRFIRNQNYFDIGSELERTILEAFINYLDSIKTKFYNLKTMAKIINLFLSHFCNFVTLNHNTDFLTENILNFIKKNYFFRCISDGKYTFMTAEQLMQKQYLLVYEQIWEHGNDNYLEELSHSKDFERNTNYVIITQDDLVIHEFKKKDTGDFLYQIFKKEEIIPIGDLIKFKRLSSLDKILPTWYLLVKFVNYESDNILEEFHEEKRLLNSDHPFMKVIVDNLDLLTNSNNQLYFDYFIAQFGPMRGGYELKKLQEYNKKILQILLNAKRITEADIEKYILTENNLPSQTRWNKDVIEYLD
jgi:hypothetical protein